MASALTFLERYHTDGEEFLNHIVRIKSDEVWVSFMNVAIKKQSKQWMHTHSLYKPKSLNKHFLPARKLMATVYLDREGVLIVEFMQQGTTITSEMYCGTLKKLRRLAIQSNRYGMLTFGMVLVHDNARPHIAARTRALVELFNWELFDHPSFSPDLSPIEDYLFTNLKN
jgi:hypothetical protein